MQKQGVTTGQYDAEDTSAAFLQTGRREAALFLREVLRQLPQPQAMLFSLHYEEELTIAQIAQVTSLPEGTVKSRLQKL